MAPKQGKARSRTAHTSHHGAMECLFCQIASRKVAAPIVFEDESSLVFLDHRPLFEGHCLLIPKTHFETLAELPSHLIGPLFALARLLAAAVEQALGADGSLVAINNRVSQSVPHLHIHVIPRRRKDGLKGFFWPRRKYRDEAEVEAVLGDLQKAVYRLKESGF